jgi:hypothetical protein
MTINLKNHALKKINQVFGNVCFSEQKTKDITYK